jgi:hypothetical protein
MTENKWNINGDIIFLFLILDYLLQEFSLDGFRSIEIILIFLNNKYYWFIYQYYFA